MIESTRENKIKQCFIVNKMFGFFWLQEWCETHLKPVYLNLVLIHQHWIRQTINVPATSCNQVTEKRNIGCDNDLVHLLFQRLIPLSLWCFWFVRCIMVRRNVGCSRITAARWHIHGSITAKAIRLLSKFLSPFQVELGKNTTSTSRGVM